MAILEKIGDPKNKETCKAMLQGMKSVEEAQTSGALDSITSVVNTVSGLANTLEPVTDFLDPFIDLADIFTGLLTSELADTLEKLFTVILTTENTKKVEKLAEKIGDLFDKVLTDDNLTKVGLFVSALLTLIDAILEGLGLGKPGEPFTMPGELEGIVPPHIWELE